MELRTSSSSTSGLVKAKSETLTETLKSSSLDFSNGDGSSHGSSKQHVMAMTLSSPSHSNRRNTHIRKAKSANPALDLAGLTGGAALSRASSASLGLSFSFTGFTVPHEEIIASERSCSNDDTCKETIIHN